MKLRCCFRVNYNSEAIRVVPRTKLVKGSNGCFCVAMKEEL